MIIGGETEMDHPAGEQSPQKCKEIIQNALNLVNGIAFDSHARRFDPAPREVPDCTPGPGDYEVAAGIRLEKRVAPVAVLRVPEQPQNDKNVGPGSYFQDPSTLMRHSHNITIPNNVIQKRKEKLVREKLRIEQQQLMQ